MLFSRDQDFERLSPVASDGVTTTLGSERVKGYCDAVLAIIATLLAVPFLKLNEQMEREILVTGQTLSGVLLSEYRLRAFFLYWASFWMVFQIWIWHGRQFHSVERVDIWLLVANWVELLGVSLVPFTAGTAANAEAVADKNSELVLDLELPFYLNLMLIVLSHLAFQLLLWYRNSNSILRVLESLCMCVPPVSAFALAMLGWRQAFISLMTFPIWQAIAGYLYSKYDTSTDSGTNATQWQYNFLQGVTRERLELFTDGVVAISATLIVLDIQPHQDCKELDFSTCVVNWNDGCRVGIKKKGFGFDCYFDYNASKEKTNLLILAYIASFAVINTLWSMHHYIFDKIHSKINFVTLMLNGQFCVFVSMLPFSFSLVTNYAIKPFEEKSIPTKNLVDALLPPELNTDRNAAATACIFASVILFGASACLLGLLLQAPVSHLDLARFMIIPCITSVSAIFLAAGFHGLLVWPLLSLPVVQVLWVFIESRCRRHAKRSRTIGGESINVEGSSGYVTFPTTS